MKEVFQPLEPISGQNLVGEGIVRGLQESLKRRGVTDGEKIADEISKATNSDIQIPGQSIIRIDIGGLPKAVEERVGINLEAITKICQIAGIAFLHIDDRAKIEDDNFGTIVGVSADGQGVSDYAHSKRPSSQHSTNQKRFNDITGTFNLKIHLDSSSLGRSVTEESDAGLNDAEEWIRAINTEVKIQILKAFLRTNFTRKEAVELITAIGIGTIVAASGAPLLAFTGAALGGEAFLELLHKVLIITLHRQGRIPYNPKTPFSLLRLGNARLDTLLKIIAILYKDDIFGLVEQEPDTGAVDGN